MGPFVRIDGFEVCRVTHDLELGGNAISSMHVACDSSNFERLAAIVAFDEADCLGNELACLEAPAHAKRRLQPERDLGRHVRELELNELVCSKGPTELLSVERVLACRSVAKFSRSHRTPCDPIPRAVEAAERTLQTFNLGQKSVFTDFD